MLAVDPMTGVVTRQALQRWTGVSVTSDEHQKEELVPPKPRYSRDAVVDARISADVASLPRMPLPGAGERSIRHGTHTGRAIRNMPIAKACGAADVFGRHFSVFCGAAVSLRLPAGEDGRALVAVPRAGCCAGTPGCQRSCPKRVRWEREGVPTDGGVEKEQMRACRHVLWALAGDVGK